MRIMRIVDVVEAVGGVVDVDDVVGAAAVVVGGDGASWDSFVTILAWE